MQDEHLRAARERIFSSDDRHLYMHVGYFLTWFSAVELQLTFLLMTTLDMRHPENFELLVKGMDARVKCERLRKAVKAAGQAIGPNFQKRLTYFENKVVPIRNKLAHTMVLMPDHVGDVHFATLARMPYDDVERYPGAAYPEKMSSLGLFRFGYWLNWFSDDLKTLNGLEIEKPLSPEAAV